MSSILPVPLQARPQQVFARLRPLGPVSLLESSKLMPGLSGWSYVSGPALATLQSVADRTTLQALDTSVQAQPLASWSDPFHALNDIMASCAALAGGQERPAGLGWTAGLVGYFGYDLVRHLEKLPGIAIADWALPDLYLQLCDHLLAFDHAASQWYFCTQDMPWAPKAQRCAVWDRTLAQASENSDPPSTTFSAAALRSCTTEAVYLEQVHKVQEFIAAGDIFQANLSHRLQASFSGDPFALYQALTAANPAPFSAYVAGTDFALASVSPERFLKRSADRVEARPIKGTRQRHPSPQGDYDQRQALASSIKDRAENLMIVDLMRNDLGRVAKVGSVQATPLFDIEAHPSVWQMVSHIAAELRPDVQVADLLRACWPPGSMTGAPKVRAMQILDTLEPVRRGPYAGALGYLDITGDLDLSVVIRTALVHQGHVMVQVGGAVVADSQAPAEWAETYAKGQRLIAVLNP